MGGHGAHLVQELRGDGFLVEWRGAGHELKQPGGRGRQRAVGPPGLPASLPCPVAGLAVMTAGFFAVHGVASGWVPVRAHADGVASAQAASLNLFAYYLGSSVFGNLAGHAWTVGGWPAVVALAVSLLVSGLLAAWLRHAPTLVSGQR
jgi:hypothetical protein